MKLMKTRNRSIKRKTTLRDHKKLLHGFLMVPFELELRNDIYPNNNISQRYSKFIRFSYKYI
jgi:hypothetical protein